VLITSRARSISVRGSSYTFGLAYHDGLYFDHSTNQHSNSVRLRPSAAVDILSSTSGMCTRSNNRTNYSVKLHLWSRTTMTLWYYHWVKRNNVVVHGWRHLCVCVWGNDISPFSPSLLPLLRSAPPLILLFPPLPDTIRHDRRV